MDLRSTHIKFQTHTTDAYRKETIVNSFSAGFRKQASFLTVQSIFSFQLIHSMRQPAIALVFPPSRVIIRIQESVGGVMKGTLRKCQELEGSAVIHTIQLYPGALLTYLAHGYSRASVCITVLSNRSAIRNTVFVLAKGLLWFGKFRYAKYLPKFLLFCKLCLLKLIR